MARRFALALLAVLLWARPAAATEAEVKACFEGPARAAADKGAGKDEFSRSIIEMGAGKLCELLAKTTILACLDALDADTADTRDQYRCIGAVANTCTASAFASSEFRKVVCIGAEEAVWLGELERLTASLRQNLEGEADRGRLDEMTRALFAYRTLKCGLTRTVFEAAEPDAAYSACVTETAARHVLDLREMNARFDDEDDEDDQDAGKPAPAPK